MKKGEENPVIISCGGEAVKVTGNSLISLSSTDESAHVFFEDEEKVSIRVFRFATLFLIFDLSRKIVRVKEGVSFFKVHITGRRATLVIGEREIIVSREKKKMKGENIEGGKKEGALLLFSLILVTGALISLRPFYQGGVKHESTAHSSYPIVDSEDRVIPVSILSVRDLLVTQREFGCDELTTILPSLHLQRKLSEIRGDKVLHRRISALIGTIHNHLNHISGDNCLSQ